MNKPYWRILAPCASLLVMAAFLAVFLARREGAREGRDGLVPVPGREGRWKTAARERAERRAYDGAPPVIPHPSFGAACTSCHTSQGIEVKGVGFAPPSPHEKTPGMGGSPRCQQCHVFQAGESLFAENTFEGLPQDLRSGERLYAGAPPIIPHALFMREHCLACHTGPAAREEVRCSHPDRLRCQQCHVPAVVSGEFARAVDGR